jgi:hypothetical protein
VACAAAETDDGVGGWGGAAVDWSASFFGSVAVSPCRPWAYYVRSL